MSCPITGEIFRNPVIASDGNTYEECALGKWLRSSSRSPVTREDMLGIYFSNRIVKNIIDDGELNQSPDRHPESCLDCLGGIVEYFDFLNWDSDMFHTLDTKVLKVIIDNIDLGARKGKNLAPIHFIFQYGSVEIIKYAIDKNQSLEVEDRFGQPPLQYLCAYSVLSAVEHLLSKGIQADMNACYTAFVHTNRKIFDYLAQKIYDEKKDGLLFDIIQDPDLHFDFFSCILDKFDFDLSCTDNEGLTVLHRVIQMHNLDHVKKLVESGAPLDLHTESIGSLLHFALWCGSGEIITYLVRAGIDLECADYEFEEPLFYAIKVASNYVIMLLLDHMGDRVKVDEQLLTITLEHKKYPVIEKLLRLCPDEMVELAKNNPESDKLVKLLLKIKTMDDKARHKFFRSQLGFKIVKSRRNSRKKKCYRKTTSGREAVRG